MTDNDLFEAAIQTYKDVFKNSPILKKKTIGNLAKRIALNYNIEIKNKNIVYYRNILANFIIYKKLNNYSDKIYSSRAEKKKFYESKDWRKIRYEVLRENGGKCCLCGRSAKDGVILHVDHIIPISKCWSKRLDKSNLQVLCEDCNVGKSNTDFIDWRHPKNSR